jgi:hypothetical protein
MTSKAEEKLREQQAQKFSDLAMRSPVTAHALATTVSLSIDDLTHCGDSDAYAQLRCSVCDQGVFALTDRRGVSYMFTFDSLLTTIKAHLVDVHKMNLDGTYA